ncbi:hypothetical protein PEC301899_05360 [Pectobacterium carotovorum subsp. carotovorum]|nr:hypothetical protein PEC301899_05360 [Pectobacterium carotovorum subsp. carotovorum]
MPDCLIRQVTDVMVVEFLSKMVVNQEMYTTIRRYLAGL